MTVSNRLFAAAAMAALFAAPALGQTPPPPPPYPVPQATGAPRILPGMQEPAPQRAAEPAPDGPGSNSAGPAPVSQGGGSGITVSSLGEVEGPPTGTLDAANGGLGMGLWSGSGRASVEDLMARLPLPTPIGSLRKLARRIVLTKAITPTGEAPRAFMTVRIQRLLDAGLLNDAADLAAQAQVRNDPGFARVQAAALLFAGRSAHLCDNTTSTRLDSSEPFWIELRAYCYAVAGNDASLSLTRAVMNAQNINDDAFDALLGDVQDNVSKNPGSIDAPTALHAFLMEQVGLPVDFDTGAQLGTPGLVLVARNAANPAADRLKAASRILRTGALGPNDLTAIADAQHFTKDQFATEHAQVQKLPFLAGQALLRQAVGRVGADARPALVFEALRHGEAKGLLGIAAVLQQAALTNIVPQPSLHDMAPLFMRALIMTGHAHEAAQWLGVLDPRNDADKPVIARFRALLALALPAPDRQAAAQLALGELAQEVANKTSSQSAAALTLGLYATLGQPIPAPQQPAVQMAMQTHWPGRRPAPSTLRRLTAAMAAPGRRGEALMLVLDTIGTRGPRDLAPDVTAMLVRDLVRLDVPDAAKAIAITALLRYRPAPAPVAPPPAPQ